MVVITKREANRLTDLLCDFTTDKKDPEVLQAINNMKEFFSFEKRTQQIAMIDSYFKDFTPLIRDWTAGGIMKHVCDNVIGCSYTSGYDYLEDILNRFALELTRLNYF